MNKEDIMNACICVFNGERERERERERYTHTYTFTYRFTHIKKKNNKQTKKSEKGTMQIKENINIEGIIKLQENNLISFTLAFQFPFIIFF